MLKLFFGLFAHITVRFNAGTETVMNSIPTKTISFNGFLESLQLAPEAVLRNHGVICFTKVNTENPVVTLYPKDLDTDNIDLPRGGIDLLGIEAHLDTGVLTPLFEGNLPTELATQLNHAISMRELKYDENGYASYGFFARKRDEQSIFLGSQDAEDAIRIPDIKEHSLQKLGFAITPENEIVLSALANGKFYECVTFLSSLVSGFKPSWKGIEISGSPIGNDLCTRLVDGQVATVMATEDGAYMYRDGEVTMYKDTKGKAIRRVASFSGVVDSSIIQDNDDVVGNLYFIADDGEKIGMWTSPLAPTGKITNISMDDELTELLGLDDVNLISAGDRTYFGTPRHWSVIETFQPRS